MKTGTILRRFWLSLLVGLTIVLIVMLSVRLYQFTKQSTAMASQSVELANQLDHAQATAQALATRLENAEEGKRELENEITRTLNDLQEANQQLVTARIQELNLLAELEEKAHPQLSLLLSLEAGRLGDPTPATAIHQSLVDRLQQIGLQQVSGDILQGAGIAAKHLQFSPDGRWLAAGAGNLTRVWDLRADIQNAEPVELAGESSAFSQNGGWLATAETGTGGRAYLWDLTNADRFKNPKILLEDEKGFSAVTFDPQSQWLALGSYAGETYVWDLHSTDPTSSAVVLPRKPSYAVDYVTALAFSPDGGRLASANFNSSISVWEITADKSIGDPLVLVGKLYYEVRSIAFSPSGRWLASGEAGAVRLWDMEYREPEYSGIALAKNEVSMPFVAFSRDGHWLASNGVLSDLLWDMRSEAPPFERTTFNEHAEDFGACTRTPTVFSQDSKWLATCGENNTIRLWDLEYNDPFSRFFELRGHDGPITAMAISLDGDRFASGSADGSVRVWEIQDLGQTANPVTWHVEQQRLTILTQSPKGGLLASASEKIYPAVENYYYTWSVEGWTVKVESPSLDRPDTSDESSILELWNISLDLYHNKPVELTGHSGQILSVAISPDQHWLAAGGKDGIAWLWDLQQAGAETKPIQLSGHAVEIRGVGFTPDSRWLVTGSLDLTARLWDLKSGDPSKEPIILRGHEAGITKLALTRDGRWLATGSLAGVIFVWDLSAADPGESPIFLEGHAAEISALAFSPDGHWLVSGGIDGISWLWDIQATNPPESPITLDGLKAVSGFEFSADGRWLASKPEVRLWDMETAKPGISVLTPVPSVHFEALPAISPDGRWLALAEGEGIALIDLTMPGEAGAHFTLPTDGERPFTMFFTPDSRALIAAESSAISQWRFEWEAIQSLACQAAGRNMTQAEWLTFFPGKPYHKTCELWSEGEYK